MKRLFYRYRYVPIALTLVLSLSGLQARTVTPLQSTSPQIQPPTLAPIPGSTATTTPPTNPTIVPEETPIVTPQLPSNPPASVNSPAPSSSSASTSSQGSPPPITMQPESIPTITGKITLSKALELADTQNPQLLAARQNINSSQQDIHIAGEIPNPQIQYQQTFGNIVTTLGNPQQANVNEQFETAGKRRKRIDVAKSTLKLTQDQFNSLRWDIRGETRQAYADLAAAQANIDATERQAQLLRILVDIADKRFQAGASPKSDVLQAELALSQIDTQRNQALSELQQAEIHFNTLLGTVVPEQIQKGYQITDQGIFKLSAEKTELVPPSDEAMPPLNDLYQKAFHSRTDLLTALQQIKVNKEQLRLIKSQRIPDLYMTGGYYYVNAPSPTSPTGAKSYFDGIFIQAGVTLPLFHNQRAEIAKANVALTQADLQALSVSKQIQDDVHTAYVELQTAKDNIRLYQDNLIPASANVLHMSRESYQYGKTPLSSVIVAQQADQQIRQGYLQAVIDYQKAWGDLEKATGTPLTL